MVSLSTIVIGFAWLSTILSQNCQIKTRREIRDLSNNERARLFEAIRKLHYANGNVYEGYTQWHINGNLIAHDKPAFLPWHRQYIYNFERSLQDIDPSVVLPYWDWSRDYEFPHRSVIFSNSYLGGNGRQGDRCVVDGAFANWGLVVPNRHCLKRDFRNGNTLPQLSSPQEIEAILRTSRSYDEFRRILEAPSHGIVHNYIGGRAGDFSKMISPNDPLFYLHHAFVDLLWNEWQMRNPHLASTYNGDSARPSDIMSPFNVQVQSTFRTTDYCYRYPRYSGRLPRALENAPQSFSSEQEQSDSMSSGPIPNNAGTDTPRFSGLNSLINKLNNLPRPMSSPMPGGPSKFGGRGGIMRKEPLTEEFIRANHLNLTEVRANERIMANLVDALNNAADA